MSSYAKNLPDGWKLTRLGRKSYIKARLGWKGLKAEEYVDKGFIFLSTPNIKGHQIDFDNVNYISERRYLESPEIMLKCGDVLLVKDGSTLGTVNIVRYLPFPATVNSSIAVIRPLEELEGLYLYFYIQGEEFQNEILNMKGGLAIPHIFQADLKEFPILLPPFSEQQKIAQILDTIDNLITLTDLHIAKLKLAKAGLLHDLLTRGIDENGELRDPIEHPEQFKETALGRIPKDWDIQKIRNIASVKYGINEAVDQSLSTGIPTITLPCINKEGDLNLDKDLLALSHRTRVRVEDILQIGDLLFNWRNGSQDHLGKTAYFNNLGEYTHVGFLLKIRTDPKVCNARYLWWRINYMKTQGFFLRAKSQVNNTFNSEELNNVLIVLPSMSEQERIVNALKPLQARIDAKQVQINKFKATKKGLMSDLLTGRVRVNLDTIGQG